jgi:hypothetical protein
LKVFGLVTLRAKESNIGIGEGLVTAHDSARKVSGKGARRFRRDQQERENGKTEKKDNTSPWQLCRSLHGSPCPLTRVQNLTGNMPRRAELESEILAGGNRKFKQGV